MMMIQDIIKKIGKATKQRGILYVVEDFSTGVIKIGWTKRPLEARLKRVVYEYYCKTKQRPFLILHVILKDVTLELEKSIHHWLTQERAEDGLREWYKPTPLVQLVVQILKALEKVPPRMRKKLGMEIFGSYPRINPIPKMLEFGQMVDELVNFVPFTEARQIAGENQGGAQ